MTDFGDGLTEQTVIFYCYLDVVIMSTGTAMLFAICITIPVSCCFLCGVKCSWRTQLITKQYTASLFSMRWLELKCMVMSVAVCFLHISISSLSFLTMSKSRKPMQLFFSYVHINERVE